MRLDQAQRVFPRALTEWLVALLLEAPSWGIDTPNEDSSFLSMIAQETGGLTVFQENLSYSADRLVQVWPKRFTLNPLPGTNIWALPRDARAYAQNPRALAEFVYGGRMGNGKEGCGDGWKYRGKGPPMLTGRNNYTRAQNELGIPLVTEPDLMLVPAVGSRVACWFWKAGGFDAVDDDNDVRAETRMFQGGEEGLAQRQRYFDALMQAQRG